MLKNVSYFPLVGFERNRFHYWIYIYIYVYMSFLNFPGRRALNGGVVGIFSWPSWVSSTAPALAVFATSETEKLVGARTGWWDQGVYTPTSVIQVGILSLYERLVFGASFCCIKSSFPTGLGIGTNPMKRRGDPLEISIVTPISGLAMT